METLPSTESVTHCPQEERTLAVRAPSGSTGTGRRQQERGESLGDALITEVGELGGGCPSWGRK